MPKDVQAVTQESIEGAFANHVNEKGKRGSLIFTGATASVGGNVSTSTFSAGKHALRAFSQSLAKEVGKQNIHVSHAIIDGGILTNLTRQRQNDPELYQNEDIKSCRSKVKPRYVSLFIVVTDGYAETLI
ncbi:hypothetical protein DFS33DRAFT_1388788 [Desarmillaria ectypa]|nr:hypothetical protein DFS33DRAFT_1388788 [Desarmillaria ectypa]